jgi:GrpB-like predicted nucleotidyltransferase (UPF0157 family)
MAPCGINPASITACRCANVAHSYSAMSFERHYCSAVRQPVSPTIAIVEYDARWPEEFNAIARRLRTDTSTSVARIDHIGSTSVPSLPAKDVIDVQISVVDEAALETVAEALAGRGWRLVPEIVRDHVVSEVTSSAAEWQKRFLREPQGERRMNVHVRVQGRANQRYALLFRDFLRSHPEAAAAYAMVKKGLAALAPDLDRYADAKDPACDLIYLAAERWAEDVGWPERGPSTQ